jgi:hypothetical protein
MPFCFHHHFQITSGGGTPNTPFTASVVAAAVGGALTGVTITSNGYGYTSDPTLVITYPETTACATATAACKSTPQSESITGVTITAAGNRYLPGRVSYTYVFVSVCAYVCLCFSLSVCVCEHTACKILARRQRWLRNCVCTQKCIHTHINTLCRL